MTSTACLIVKDEQRAIPEWFAFHHVIGFDEFIIYDNGSVDQTPQIINQIARRRGGITYVDWPDAPRERPQITAYNDALRRCRTDWIAFLDADEFLVLLEHRNVNDFLRSLPQKASAVALNWLIFGSSGRINPSRGLVMERFKRCASSRQAKTRLCKSILRTREVAEMFVHSGRLQSGSYVNALGQEIEIEDRSRTPQLCLSRARINHYLLKSRKEFIEKKRRGNAARSREEGDKFTHRDNQDYWISHDLNGSRDLEILRWREDILNQIADWGLEELSSEGTPATKQGLDSAAGRFLRIQASNVLSWARDTKRRSRSSASRPALVP